jgi:preprotein translocase subunit SecA
VEALRFVAHGGRLSATRLSRWRGMAKRAIRLTKELASLSDADLLRRGREIRWRAKSGIPISSLAVEAAALVRDASRRALGMEQYPVQLVGGFALFEGHITEMQTGEGKTLTAVLPSFLRALPGKGSYVITVNDYLAERDADQMKQVHERLGVTVGCITSPMEPDERRVAYAKDITYGTAKEMGFDFLRDRLRVGAGGDITSRHGALADGTGEAPVQRGHYFALVDEADSVLIDDARTPLIIGLMQPNEAPIVNLYRWCHRAVLHLEANIDFLYDPNRRTAYLTDPGCRKILLMSKPTLMDTIDTEKIYTNVEKALTARFAFEKDRDYVVVDDKVSIVDESTGRMMEGRKWQDGLHQAIEAKELIPITASTGQAAKVTVQSFFRHFTHLGGMTGTAAQARSELRKSYHLPVSIIPTHRPCIRSERRSRVFATMEAKWNAVVDSVDRIHCKGRSVLVGTPSVDASEALGALLKERGIVGQILNAKYLEREAEFVSKAGQPGNVTIATNMAGRGTDIELHDDVCAAGGLHVIATEMHSSVRIDRQLIGRAARQGDPGSYQFFLSLEDELLRCLKEEKRKAIQKSARPNAKGELDIDWLSLFEKTQRFLERTHRKERKQLLKQEKQRSEQYEKMGLDPYLELTE